MTPGKRGGGRRSVPRKEGRRSDPRKEGRREEECPQERGGGQTLWCNVG